MKNHTFENKILKQELTKYQQIFGKIPYIDDSLLKGSYKLMQNIKEGAEIVEDRMTFIQDFLQKKNKLKQLKL